MELSMLPACSYDSGVPCAQQASTWAPRPQQGVETHKALTGVQFLWGSCAWGSLSPLGSLPAQDECQTSALARRDCLARPHSAPRRL